MPNTRKCEGIIQNTETLWAVNKNYKTAQDAIMSVNKLCALFTKKK